MIPTAPTTPLPAAPASPLAVSVVDIHCHLLPGMDDGPETLEQSIALCRLMWREGVTRAVATPHQLGRYDLANTSARVRALVLALRESLRARRIGLDVHAGGEVRLDERIGRLLADDLVTSLGDGRRWILIELPPGLAVEPDAVFSRLCTNANAPAVVLAHAERYEFIRKDRRAAQRWVDAGAVLQVNNGSLAGTDGSAEAACAWDLVTSGLAGIVASDAHNLSTRLPLWSATVRALIGRVGIEATRRLCQINPSRLLDAPSEPKQGEGA